MVIPRRKGTRKVLRRCRPELLDQRSRHLLELAAGTVAGRVRSVMERIEGIKRETP